MFDILRSAQRLESSAKLSNILARLFWFADSYRPADLITLLDAVDEAICAAQSRIDEQRKGV